VEGRAVGEPAVEAALTAIGELMRQAHRGYTSIGLGCHELDVMLQALSALGPGKGVYGARVSGGGSGGTVVVLCREDAIPAVEALAQRLTFGKPFAGLIR
jgi:galactokinase